MAVSLIEGRWRCDRSQEVAPLMALLPKCTGSNNSSASAEYIRGRKRGNALLNRSAPSFLQKRLRLRHG